MGTMTQMKNPLHMIAALLMVAALMLCTSQTVEATTYTMDMSKGNYTLESNKTYRAYGSTTKYGIKVDGTGIVLHLDSVTMDLRNEGDSDKSAERPAINVTENSQVTIYIDGNNYLEGGNHTGIGKNTGYAGIHVGKGAKVTILGNGKLEIKGGGHDEPGAAIGGNYDYDDVGKITIGDSSNSPTIIAKGAGSGSAGIGSGEEGRIKNSIVINNGNIAATGGQYAAGIGSGNKAGTGAGGTGYGIVINGGKISATGGEGAAGIGGSEDGDFSDITINGGEITAIGGSEGAGIGGGEEGYMDGLTITGGTITATGGSSSAGIGGGNAKGGGNGGDINNMKITGGTIKATGGTAGAGIGGGDASAVTNFVIDEANANSLKITANGGKWGAGIGSAGNDAESTNLDPIKITLKGGTITAKGGSQGAGIGGGNTSAEKIEIYGYGAINATGYDGSCAIGAGECEDGGLITIVGNSDSQRLVIQGKALGSNPNQAGADNAAVIGGADAGGEDIAISYADLTLESQFNSWGTAIGTGGNHQMFKRDMGDITIKNCNIKDASANSRDGASIGAGSGAEVDDILIENSKFEGSAIGSCYNGNEFFVETSIESITIKNSKITAISGKGQKAAIGSGAYAAIKEITIENSNIYAEANSGAGIGSGGYEDDSTGDAVKWTGCECGDITIKDSTVTAKGNDGSAGIGGGWGTSVGDITIDHSEVEASAGKDRSGNGGAGIGGGHAESCGNIDIKDSSVTATAAAYAAGIGSGGDNDGGAFLWNSTCHSITMSDSKITATGGYGSAGIGTAQESQFSNSAAIEIDNCEVTATGGDYGAGIGAGKDGYAGTGGEASIDITISGKSQVTATGGIGGAGIGGGYDGGADSVFIELADTVRDSNNQWQYYVKATGGKGAAGIGSGGVYQKAGGLTQAGHDIDFVRITGGYVSAKGGDDEGGAGAGIGGGAHGGNINGLYVSGGFIEAKAGSGSGKYAADDIGTGGHDDIRTVAEDENFFITGGTILGSLSSDPDVITIDGGSVRYNISDVSGQKAKRTSGDQVYRTQMKVETAHGQLEELKTSQTSTMGPYGSDDIFADANGMVYLYLPEFGENKATADFVFDGKNHHYYGTVSKVGNSWLKMSDAVDIVLLEVNSDQTPEELIVDQKFRAQINQTLTSQVTYEVTGDAVRLLDENDQEVSSLAIEAGKPVTLIAKDFGTFIIDVKGGETDQYWGVTGTYTGKVTKAVGTIQFTENPIKIYDGTPVENPAVTTNSDGIVKYTYRNTDDNTDLGSTPPTDAGNYSVIAKVAGTDNYTECSTGELTFTIEKRPVTLSLTATEKDTDATVTAEVTGFLTDKITSGEALGEVTFTVDGKDKSQPVEVVEQNDGQDEKYVAAVTFTGVEASDYIVKAGIDGAKNYVGVEPVTQKFKKNHAERQVQVALKYNKQYGDGEFNIKATTNPQKAQDSYSYEVIWDAYKVYGAVTVPEQAQAVSIDDSGEVTVQNAGMSIVKITLTDGTGQYADAVAYTTITVDRATLNVTPYVYEKGDSQEKPVRKATYGALGGLEYGLRYGEFVGGQDDDAATFTKGHGTLQPAKLKITSGVGTYTLGINKVPAKGENYFLSRNYKIEIGEANLEVTKAPLTITPDDATGQYGIEPEYTYQVGGLTAWDSEKKVFGETLPVVALADNKEYNTLIPREKPYELVISNQTAIKAALLKGNYEVTSAEAFGIADLTITKAPITIMVDRSVREYNGQPLSITPTITTNNGLEYDGSSEVTYAQITKDGLKKLEPRQNPQEVGLYYVTVTAAPTDCYLGASDSALLRIKRATPNPELPQLDNMYYEEGLTLADKKLPTGWSWVDPDKELFVGSVGAYAVYTPKDTHNYRRVVKMLWFDVLETPDDSNGSSDDTGGGGTGSSDSERDDPGGGNFGSNPGGTDADATSRTGDSSNTVLWFVLSGTALMAAGAVLLTGRRRKF